VLTDNICTTDSEMSTEDYPHGAIPKINPAVSKHRRLFTEHSAAPYLLTTFTNARWLENSPREYDSLMGPHQELIVANVEDDDDLVGRTPDDEMERVGALNPDFYIPSDRWVYEDTMTPAAQLKEIDRCMSGTRAVYNRIQDRDDLSTSVIPLAKGWKVWHFERCRRTIDDLGIDYCAFDVTQYESIYMILDDVRTLIDVIQPSGILLIGRIAPDHLRRCPAEVVAATGVNHWRKNCEPASGELSREAYGNWATDANNALTTVPSETRQSRLDQFPGITGVQFHG